MHPRKVDRPDHAGGGNEHGSCHAKAAQSVPYKIWIGSDDHIQLASIRCHVDQLRGRDHTLALLTTGKVIDGAATAAEGFVDVPEYCTTPAPTRAVEVIMREPMTSIAAGHGVSLGITEQRNVVIWGANGAGIDGRIGAVAPATPLLLELGRRLVDRRR